MSADLFFLDTNIFVYTLDGGSQEKNDRARELVRKAIDSRKGVVSYQVVQEFFNVAFRRFSQPMNIAEAEQYLMTVLRPLLAVHSSPALYFEALRITEKYEVSWYDSLMLAAAIEGGCEKVYSEDFQHGQKIENMKIENPFI